MRSHLIVSPLLLAALCACKTVSTHNNHRPPELVGELIATSIIEPRSGSNAYGQVWFTENVDGIQVYAKLHNLKPGKHGIHIHEKGDCSAYDASSAGEHYNPLSKHHGAPDPRNYHVGDLGNIKANKNGDAVLNLTIPKAHLNKHYKNYANIRGKSVVIHAGADDLHSQPSGKSGDRIGCGVIK